MAYSQDLRERVVTYVEEGNTQLCAAQQFSLNPKTVREWLDLKKETGFLKPREHRGGPRPCVTKEELKSYVDAHPNAILKDMAEEFNVTIPGIAYHLHKHGFVQKKRA